jgi:hypothetical protein
MCLCCVDPCAWRRALFLCVCMYVYTKIHAMSQRVNNAALEVRRREGRVHHMGRTEKRKLEKLERQMGRERGSELSSCLDGKRESRKGACRQTGNFIHFSLYHPKIMLRVYIMYSNYKYATEKTATEMVGQQRFF